MQEFIHHKVQVYENFLKNFNEIQILFGKRSYDFERQFEDFADQLLSYFKTNGNTTIEAEILKITNMLSLVKKGFNPVSLQKIQTGRREAFWGFAFNALENVYEILMKLFTTEHIKLEEGEEIISNLMIGLIQNGLLSDPTIKSLNSIEKIEVYWLNIMSQNESFSSIDKKLKMSLMTEDIYLLFEKNLSKINT
ncbi:hypothetical protein [Kaistella yonginensis]|uniref:hypothetical protein n=1 Tax=Kaistella yonginensis TaxID=658267 RepID=UPI0025B54AF8|nr:hypothetical protein [Kaistella yonginensis]MDN3605333.1 hypothetical protein [Kaistella yonginensis]